MKENRILFLCLLFALSPVLLFRTADIAADEATVTEDKTTADLVDTETSTDKTVTSEAETAAADSTGAQTTSAITSKNKTADNTATDEETAAEITPAELSLNTQITGPITEDKKLCLTLSKKIKSILFKMEGSVNKNLTAFEPQPQTHCANLLIADFPDGSYKLTVETKQDLTQGEKTTFNTLDVKINKGGSKIATDQKNSELENKCSQAGADSSDECKEFYWNKYKEKITCKNFSDTECSDTGKIRILKIVETAKQYASINAHAGEILNKTMTAGKLENIINQSDSEKTLNLSAPLKEKETQITIVPSYENIIMDKSRGLIQTAPIAVLIDSDGDGVSDDTEKRLGTKPNNKDTDGDGYKDGEEIKNGYNPLSDGKKDMELFPIEKALIQGKAIEHPRTGGEASAALTVTDAKAVYTEDNKETGYVFSGKADANSLVTLYIYSDIPIVATAGTDGNGKWEYRLEKPLEIGDHEIYAATNDEAGKIIKKSSPLNFKAEETKTAPAETAPVNSPTGQTNDNTANYYLYGAAGLAFLGILVFLIALLKSRKKAKKQKEEETPK